MATPEKLSLWDRLFNRKRREVHNRGKEIFSKVTKYNDIPIEHTRRNVKRNWIEYRVIDRVTGSETIEREYLD